MSLEFGSRHGKLIRVRYGSNLPVGLMAMRSSFVTVELNGRLRGCIGRLEASRALVIDVADKEKKPSPVRMANPEIVWVSDDNSFHEEGCLSLPEHYADVSRPDVVRVRYLDEMAVECVLEADGMLATCVQHEIDHLEGILFVDHLTSLKRNIILRKLVKVKRQALVKSA